MKVAQAIQPSCHVTCVKPIIFSMGCPPWLLKLALGFTPKFHFFICGLGITERSCNLFTNCQTTGRAVSVDRWADDRRDVHMHVQDVRMSCDAENGPWWIVGRWRIIDRTLYMPAPQKLRVLAHVDQATALLSMHAVDYWVCQYVSGGEIHSRSSQGLKQIATLAFWCESSNKCKLWSEKIKKRKSHILVKKKKKWMTLERPWKGRWDIANISRTPVEPGGLTLCRMGRMLVLNASNEASRCKCNTVTDWVSRFAEPPSGHPQRHYSPTTSVFSAEQS